MFVFALMLALAAGPVNPKGVHHRDLFGDILNDGSRPSGIVPSTAFRLEQERRSKLLPPNHPKAFHHYDMVGVVLNDDTYAGWHWIEVPLPESERKPVQAVRPAVQYVPGRTVRRRFR